MNGCNITAGQQDYAERLSQIESQKEDYYRELGIAPGIPTMKGSYGDPENTGVGYNTIIRNLGDHSVPAEWAEYVKKNENRETAPGAPIAWEKASQPEEVQPGYGYVADNNESEETFYYHSDHLGSTSYITDDSAHVTQYTAYLPYGELLVDEHSSSEDMPYKFNGKELDEETGLYYYGARYMQSITSVWYGIDPLTEKYPDVSAYVYCAGNPVKLVDSDGLEPIKPQAGTVQGFINELSTTGTKSGLKRGNSASQALLGFGTIEFDFPRPMPAKTGRINTYKNKYIYTENGGWIDMAHFMFYAGKAYAYKLQKERSKALVNEKTFALLPIEAQQAILKESLQSPVGEAVQDGYFQERTDAIVAKHSAFSYEDLPSDKFGADFGANYFDPNSNLSLGEQLKNYLDKLGATTPEEAPNYQSLPSKEPTKKPSRTNKTTTPMYTKNNP